MAKMSFQSFQMACGHPWRCEKIHTVDWLTLSYCLRWAISTLLNVNKWVNNNYSCSTGILKTAATQKLYYQHQKVGQFNYTRAYRQWRHTGISARVLCCLPCMWMNCHLWSLALGWYLHTDDIKLYQIICDPEDCLQLQKDSY